MTGIDKTIRPNGENHKKYLRLFELYKTIYPRLTKTAS